MRMADYTPASHPLMVHLPANLVEEVDALCAANYLDRTNFFIMALKLYLEMYGVEYVPESCSAHPIGGMSKELNTPTPAALREGDEEEYVLMAAEDE